MSETPTTTEPIQKQNGDPRVPEKQTDEIKANNKESKWYDFVQVVITELNDTHLTKENSDSNAADSETSSINDKRDCFYIEEPYDYIFEPDHYPNDEQHRRGSQSSETNSMETQQSENGKSSIESTKNKAEDLNEIKNENKFTYATVVGENNGFLEYEYKNYTYKRNLYTNRLKNENMMDHLDNDFYLLNDYIDNHLNALIRGVSLSKWPSVGFGFTLAKQTFGTENIFFICDIKPNSPAEFGLQLGDILIEVDDLNTRENFKNLDEISAYLEMKESIHVLAIHESKYHWVMSKTDFLKNHHMNCEDIVIVSHSR